MSTKHFWVGGTTVQPNGAYDGTRSYQLSSDYQPPIVSESEMFGRWEEYPLVHGVNCFTDRWVCFVRHAQGGAAVVSTQLGCIKGFGGIWFKGQGGAGSWCMNPAMLIDEQGNLHTFDNGEVPMEPAVPAKARFWII